MECIVCAQGMLQLLSLSKNASKGVFERLLKLHGRWKTDEAKDMYVLETECYLFCVKKYLKGI